MSRAARWATFWEGQVKPLHAEDNEIFYKGLADEARLLIDRQSYASVLEIGCGSGSLYPHIGFAGRRYRGVDVSASMLAEFRRREPGVDVVQSPGESYVCAEKFDLIFSLGVLQYFDDAMLAQHLRNAAQMLAPGGRIIHMHLPLRAMRTAYAMNWLSLQPRHPLRGLLSVFRLMLPQENGRWFRVKSVAALARQEGLQTQIFGSMVQPYRGSFVFTRA